MFRKWFKRVGRSYKPRCIIHLCHERFLDEWRYAKKFFKVISIKTSSGMSRPPLIKKDGRVNWWPFWDGEFESYYWITIYSVLHFLFGMVCWFFHVSLFWATAAQLTWELWENSYYGLHGFSTSYQRLRRHFPRLPAWQK